MPRVSFAGVRELGPVPGGHYTATLTKVDYVAKPKSNPDGDPYLKLTLTLGDDEEEYKGRKVFRNVSLGEDSLWACKKYMIALGSDADFEDEEGFDIVEAYQDLIGNECTVVLEVKELPGGRTTNEVRDITEQGFS